MEGPTFWKLDADGNFVWVRTLNGSGERCGNALALDAAGNLCITGYFSGTVDFDPGPGTYNLSGTGTRRLFLWKLDSAGNFVWARSVGGTTTVFGNAIAVDAQGAVYATGTFGSTADFDPGEGVCSLTSVGEDDIFLLKLDAAGNFLWVGSVGSTYDDYGGGVTAAADGSVYFTGDYWGTADFDPGPGTVTLDIGTNTWQDAYVLRLDAAGGFLSVTKVGAWGGDRGYDIAIGADGSVFTIGFFSGTADFDPGPATYNLTSMAGDSYDMFLWKLRANRPPTGIALASATVYEYARHNLAVGTLVPVDPDPGEVFTYELLDSAGGRFKLVGSQVVVDHGELLDAAQAASHTITVRARDYAGATCQETLTIQVLPALSASGMVWSDQDGDGVRVGGEAGVAGAVVEGFLSADAVVGNADDVSIGYAVTDADGRYMLRGIVPASNYYLIVRTPAGYTAFAPQDVGGDDTRDCDVGAAGATAMFALTTENRVDLDAGLVGAPLGFGFAFRVGGSGADAGRTMATDSAGNVYLAGNLNGTADVDPGPGVWNLNGTGALVAKYSNRGALCWARSFLLNGLPLGLSLAADNSILITGYYSGTVDFDPGAGVQNLTSVGSTDAFVLKLDDFGDFLWARSMGGTSDDRGTTIATAGDGSVYTTGQFYGTADFDPGPGVFSITSAGGYDVFVAKLDAGGELPLGRPRRRYQRQRLCRRHRSRAGRQRLHDGRLPLETNGRRRLALEPEVRRTGRKLRLWPHHRPRR